MKKIPTLFEREFANHKVVGISGKVTPGMEWVLNGEGVATVKIDGACCAVIDGRFYKRYDAKKGKRPPKNAIPCCDPDPITGHHPHWVPVDWDNPTDKWFANAYLNSIEVCKGYTLNPGNGTYEAIGPHFNGNPHNIKLDVLIPHGNELINVERSFEGIKEYLKLHEIEGIVFWLDGEPMCKIKRTDFGFEWPVAPKEG